MINATFKLGTKYREMRRLAFIGAITLASIVVGVIIGHTISGFFPLKDVDVFAFVVSTLTIIVGLFTFLGATVAIIQAITVQNTWNDIDKRTNEIVQRHQQEATDTLNKDKEARQRELDARQQQLDEAAKQAIDLVNDLTSKSNKHIRRGTYLLAGLGIWSVLFVGYSYYQLRKLRKNN